MSDSYKGDIQTIGKHVVAMNYEYVQITNRVFSVRLPPDEAIMLYEWLQHHKDELYEYAQKRLQGQRQYQMVAYEDH
jgi:hypothetical protein